jgi:hypothetical protein
MLVSPLKCAAEPHAQGVDNKCCGDDRNDSSHEPKAANESCESDAEKSGGGEMLNARCHLHAPIMKEAADRDKSLAHVSADSGNSPPFHRTGHLPFTIDRRRIAW